MTETANIDDLVKLTNIMTMKHLTSERLKKLKKKKEPNYMDMIAIENLTKLHEILEKQAKDMLGV